MSEQNKKRPMSLQGMIRKLALVTEDNLQLLIDIVEDPELSKKERAPYAKFLLATHASLLAQQEQETKNKQTMVMNNYRIRKEQRDEEEARQAPRLANSYKNNNALSMDIVYKEEDED